MSRVARKRNHASNQRVIDNQSTAGGADGAIMLSALLLVSMGVVMSFSTTATLALEQRIPPLFLRHVGALATGLAVGFVAYRLPTHVWRRLALPLWAATVIMLILTGIFGVEVKGAQRWLAIPGLLRFQPGEIAKFATILAVAAVISRREGHEELSTRRALIAASLALPPMLLLIIQPDLGNTLLTAILVAGLLVVGGTRLARLVVPGVLMTGFVVIYVARNAYALRRITGFLDPWANKLGEGYQLVQSMVAFGRGGLFGVGIGNGQQKLAYLPEAHTDFILALVAEELGLVGVLVVLGGFAGLVVAGTRIARQSVQRFDLLVAFGMTALLTVPALINASVVMGLLPTKGLTLPFLSYGRTSLIMSCLALGLLLGCAREEGPTRKRAGTARWR
ncbi:MAG: putative lipid II flippase FtsW [Myxococcota bacterium]|nr:putative lipid II flippase FtsW [Myxococcota bacterium]